MNEKLKILQEHLSILDKTVTKTEFLKAFEDFLKIATAIERALVAKIELAVSKIKNGVDGKDGRDGKDGKDGKQGERGAQGQPGLTGDQGAAGKDGVNGSPDTADDIRNKLELLPEGEKLKIDAIEDLRKELDELKKQKPQGGGASFVISRGAIRLYDLSDQLDGVTKTFALPAFWRVLQVNSSSTPNAFRPTTDYTTDGSLMKITFTSAIDAPSTLAAGQTLTILYAEP